MLINSYIDKEGQNTKKNNFVELKLTVYSYE